VLDARIPDFWPFKDAVKVLLRNGNIVSKYAGDQTESKPRRKDTPPKHTNGKSAQQRDELTHAGLLLFPSSSHGKRR
jgi:hypothetical protein